MTSTYQSLDIVPNWQRMNEAIILLVDSIPDGKLNWSPKPELWNFKGILIHICGARHNWMARDINDGETSPDVYPRGAGQGVDQAPPRTLLATARALPLQPGPARRQLRSRAGRRQPLHLHRPLDRVSPAGARHPPPGRHLPLPGAARHRDAARRYAVSGRALPPLDIADQWPQLNGQLVSLIDIIPGDKLSWSPKPGLWNFKGILLHVCMVRHNWLANRVKDGERTPDVLRDGQTKEGIKEQLRLSWQRLERFLRDTDRLAATYAVEYKDGEMVTGHWIAYHLLEHDIHHRADIFHYLALLGVAHPDVETP